MYKKNYRKQKLLTILSMKPEIQAELSLNTQSKRFTMVGREEYLSLTGKTAYMHEVQEFVHSPAPHKPA